MPCITTTTTIKTRHPPNLFSLDVEDFQCAGGHVITIGSRWGCRCSGSEAWMIDLITLLLPLHPENCCIIVVP
eukprot:6872613-Ditylum_brightwellii.AAC.1